MYVFIAFQLESNSTGTAFNWTDESPTDPWLDPWGFAFSIAAAVGSGATALALGFIYKQSKLTRKQISQTQQEIDSTLRPWLGHTSYTLHPAIPDQNGQRKSFATLKLKNYGRLPARLTRQAQLWKLTEITEEDLTKHPEETAPHVMIFPDQVSTYDRVGEEQSRIDEAK